MKVSDFHLLEDEEEQAIIHQVVHEFNQTQTEYPKESTIQELFIEVAAKTPNALAVVADEQSLTYGELDAQSNRLAHFLIAQGICREQAIGVMLGRSAEMIVALLGILKAGGCYLPLALTLPESRARFILTEARCPFVISEKSLILTLRRLQCECPELGGFLCIDSSDVGSEPESGGAMMNEKMWDYVDHDIPRGRLPPPCKHEFDRTVLCDYPAAAIGERSDARGLAYIIYTSGSTGQPKGVMVEHRGVVRLVRQTNYITLHGSDRILQTASLAFDASTFEIWGALLNGASLYLPPGEDLLDAQKLGRHIERYRATVMFLTTGLFNILVDTGIEIFRPLKCVLTGGERCSPSHFIKLRRACPELALKHLYGPAENTTLTTFYDVTNGEEGNIPIGRPIANTTVYILDEQLKPLPVGVAGELCAGGDGLARGYLNDPDLTREKFIQHPFVEGQRLYRTGDICRWRGDGNIEFIGRRDNQVKIRGYRVELEEIEACICRHEQVVDAVVLAKDVGGGSLELVAFVAGKNELEMNALRGYLLATIPGYMVPGHLVKLDKLPLSANGKIDRKALQHTSMQADHAPQREAPATATERQLASIWGEVLGHDRIGVTDDFFAAGGHSLRVIKLVALIRERIGVALPLTMVFKATTIREQSKLLLEQAQFGIEGIDEAMVLLTKAARGAPIFAFPPGTGDALGYLQLANVLQPYRFYAFNFIPDLTRLTDYADLIMSVDGAGPFVLLGYSAGGNLAYHVTAELERRGKHVSDIVMIDSSRRVRPLSFPEGEARRVADAFLNDESIKPYVTSALLHEKAYRVIERYYDFLSSTTDHHMVDANIHVLFTHESSDHFDPASGELIASITHWSKVTRSRLATYLARGEHNHMLHTSNLESNARLVKEILNGALAQQVCSIPAPAVAKRNVV